MKKRLLFVDDDAFILSALKRLLRSHRDEWDCQFANHGLEAVEMLANSVFDVVITDVRMPNMDGFELLEHIKQHHPNAVRIVLSGQTDRDTSLRAVGPAHDYLAKPCAPDQLRKALQRAVRIQDGLQDVRSINANSGLSNIDQLPCNPAVVAQLRAAIETKQPSAVLCEIVEQDAVLAIHTLIKANEETGAASICEAVNACGPATLLKIADQHEAGKQISSDQQTLTSENTRRMIDAAVSFEERSDDSVFVENCRFSAYGLAIGQIAVTAFGINSPSHFVGAQLLSDWGFSNVVCEAIRFAHCETAVPQIEGTPLAAFRHAMSQFATTD